MNRGERRRPGRLGELTGKPLGFRVPASPHSAHHPLSRAPLGPHTLWKLPSRFLIPHWTCLPALLAQVLRLRASESSPLPEPAASSSLTPPALPPLVRPATGSLQGAGSSSRWAPMEPVPPTLPSSHLFVCTTYSCGLIIISFLQNLPWSGTILHALVWARVLKFERTCQPWQGKRSILCFRKVLCWNSGEKPCAWVFVLAGLCPQEEGFATIERCFF
jgi:hypothetical protein